MKTQHYEITIDASAEKVWNILLGQDTYPAWTAVFSPSSQVQTDWQEGSRALFLDGSGNGMVSEIAVNRPNELMSIRHLGSVENGVESIGNEKSPWAGAMENYTLEQVGGKTCLLIDLDVTDEFVDYMDRTWLMALQKVKELSEASASTNQNHQRV